MTTPIAVTIAGSDSSGGAGIQADLKTFSALGVYGASAITALTAQNTKGVTAIHEVPPAFIAAQMDAVFSDLTVGAVKIGMLGNAAVIKAVAAGLERHEQTNVVLDPVMVATSGRRLLAGDAIEALRTELVPRARHGVDPRHRRAHRDPQHPRHRLHTLCRDRSRPRPGPRAHRSSARRQGVHNLGDRGRRPSVNRERARAGASLL